jgi:hypothetical protein
MPVIGFNKRKAFQGLASLLVFFGVLAAVHRLDSYSKIVTQVRLLISGVPDYLASVNKRVTD